MVHFYGILGVPCSISENTLKVHFKLKNKQKKILWDYTFERSNSYWQWIYFRFGHDVKTYPELMEQAMNESIVHLAKKLKNNPDLLK